MILMMLLYYIDDHKNSNDNVKFNDCHCISEKGDFDGFEKNYKIYIKINDKGQLRTMALFYTLMILIFS